MKIAFLAPRPKLLQEEYGENVLDSLKNELKVILAKHKKDQVLTSLSYGIEFLAGEIASDTSMVFHVFVPFDNQEKIWPPKVQNTYKDLLGRAKSVTYTDHGDWELEKLQKKDETIIQKADIIYHLFNEKTLSSLENINNKASFIKIELKKEKKKVKEEPVINEKTSAASNDWNIYL